MGLLSKYKLINGVPVETNDILEWDEWMETADRRVKLSKTKNGDVSTVFLGLDHNFFGQPPLLWETMVFGGTLDGEMVRTSSLAEAKKAHAKMLKAVKDAIQ